MSRRYARGNKGFSYVEVLIVTVLIAFSLIPAMESLQVGIQTSDIHESRTINQFRLQGRMENVLAQSVDVLRAAAGSATTINTTYSDAISEPDRLLVYIVRYDTTNADGDNNPLTGGDNNLLWVQVAIEDTADSLETLIHAF
ncbi:MAG: type IV pilus modification PilV family protein [Pseudomonadales bacterium]